MSSIIALVAVSASIMGVHGGHERLHLRHPNADLAHLDRAHRPVKTRQWDQHHPHHLRFPNTRWNRTHPRHKRYGIEHRAKLARLHQAAPGISKFDLCVANNEAGTPGADTYDTIDWTIDTGNGYEASMQWLRSTWIAQGGGRYAPRAVEATPAEQVAIFERWWQDYATQWPNTVPPCLYLR